MEKYGIALAGGGSKGIYQMGAWKALRELGIEAEAVTGTSIGAINGAFMVSNAFDKAMDMWSNIKINKCLNLPTKNNFTSENLTEKANAGMLLKEVLEKGGLDQSPFYDLLESYIDVHAVYDSAIDLGICTFSLTNYSSVKLWKNSIPMDLFIDYLIASAAFPGLKKVKVQDQIFVDGGVGDNLPFDMLKHRGIRNIIAIDLRNPKNHQINSDRLRITHICNSLNLGKTFDVRPETLKLNFELGYLDTLKTFGQYDGVHYYFPVQEYQDLLGEWNDNFMPGLEQAALMYNIPRNQVYTGKEFLQKIKEKRGIATEKYQLFRQQINIDGALKTFRSGNFKNIDPEIRLSFFLEFSADTKKNASKWGIPLSLFRDINLAAESLLLLGEDFYKLN